MSCIDRSLPTLRAMAAKPTVLRRVPACTSAIAVIAEMLEYRRWQPIRAGGGGKTGMSLLIVYVVLVIAGDLVAYLLGLVIEREVPAASLPAFLAMYFLFLWVAWVIAVRITQPRARPQ